jgi:hypothetical protein
MILHDFIYGFETKSQIILVSLAAVVIIGVAALIAVALSLGNRRRD